MGNCFSDPSKSKGQVLGSGPSSTASPGSAARPPPPAGAAGSAARRGDGQALGGGASEAGRERERALAAAEERAKAVSLRLRLRRSNQPQSPGLTHTQASNKGVNASNPNAGKLSSKLQEERRAPRSPEPQNENRMMVSLSGR